MKNTFKYKNRISILSCVRNTFNFPKISKAEYDSIQNQCDSFCERIAKEILDAKKDDKLDIPNPKQRLEHLNIVSKYGDWLGPVIKKDNKYYRCVKKESAEKFTIIWKSGLLEVFSKKGYLPKLSISDYFTDEFPIIIEQEKLEMTHVTKLSVEQAKKGLLFVSLLQQICIKIGFALIDPHYYNYTFFNHHFIYFDLGSFSTIDDYYRYHDFSMVVLGAYRILFSYFPDSVLSQRDLGDFRHNVAVSYRTDYFEFEFYKRLTYKYCKRHCTKTIYNAFKDIFNNNKCTPWNVITCFLPERKDDANFLLEEIM